MKDDDAQFEIELMIRRHARAERERRVTAMTEALRATATKSASELLAAAQVKSGIGHDPGPVVMRWHHGIYLDGGRDWDSSVEILADALGSLLARFDDRA